MRENLGVTTPDYYLYLNQSGTYTVEDVNDKKEFSDTMVSSLSLSLFFTCIERQFVFIVCLCFRRPCQWWACL